MSRGDISEAASGASATLVGARPTSVLTGAEIAFATTSGVPTDVFDDSAGTTFARQRAVDNTQGAVPEGPRLTTAQVAERLNRRPATVRRMRGDLYAAGRIERQTAYPGWQFTSSGVLPHLRQVIAVLPAGYHPCDVLAVMTLPMEELNGRSPRAWLEAGGEPTPVLGVLEELSL